MVTTIATDGKDTETYAAWARGYVTDSLYNWGRQADLIRSFARKQTGFYNQASGALKRAISHYPADNAPVLDEVYIRLESPLRAVMRVEYKSCVDATIEEKAYRCGVSRRTYGRRLRKEIAAAEHELLRAADS